MEPKEYEWNQWNMNGTKGIRMEPMECEWNQRHMNGTKGI
jgi:hypothetical protein